MGLLTGKIDYGRTERKSMDVRKDMYRSVMRV